MSSSNVEAQMGALLDALVGGQPPAEWAGRDQLPVAFPVITSLEEDASRGRQLQDDAPNGSIDSLMKSYLAAVKEVRRIDGDVPVATNPSATPHGDKLLEEKLTTLMQALNRNGSDTWEGKPAQIPLAELIESQRDEFKALLDCAEDEELHISAVTTHSSRVAAGAGAEVTLDNLVLQYAKELKQSPLVVSEEGNTAQFGGGRIAIRDATEQEQRSMQELLDALDEL